MICSAERDLSYHSQGIVVWRHALCSNASFVLQLHVGVHHYVSTFNISQDTSFMKRHFSFLGLLYARLSHIGHNCGQFQHAKVATYWNGAGWIVSLGELLTPAAVDQHWLVTWQIIVTENYNHMNRANAFICNAWRLDNA